MAYGILTDEMKALLKPFIEGKQVWDLGAGDMERAEELMQLGAHVTAIDKAPMRPVPGVTIMQTYFKALHGAPDVVFMAWPVNNSGFHGALPFIKRAPLLVYLGSNTDGSACGTHQLFLEMRSRRLVGHAPHRRNSLLVLAGRIDEPAVESRTPEEAAQWSDAMMTWENAQKT